MRNKTNLIVSIIGFIVFSILAFDDVGTLQPAYEFTWPSYFAMAILCFFMCFGICNFLDYLNYLIMGKKD